MSSRLLIVILGSLALACGIAIAFYRVLGGARPAPKTVNVVTAASDLAVGVTIREQDVRMVTMPKEFAPRRAFENVTDLKGRVVISLVLKDEPIVSNRLAAPGEIPGLATMIPSGYRAVSVRVNDVIGVAGFIQPGMRVDVLASGRLPGLEDSVTRTVLQNVTVLSAGQVLQPEPKGQVINAQVVTLQVRPDEAEILALTSGEGRVQLVLRNSADNAIAPTSGAHLRAVYAVGNTPGGSQSATSPPAFHAHEKRMSGIPKTAVNPAPVVPALPAPPRSIQIIRGTTRSDIPLAVPTAIRTYDGLGRRDGLGRKEWSRYSHALLSPV